jgi:hypothetical protein
MDKFLNQYADLTALLLTILLPIIAAVIVKRNTGKKTRAIPVYFLVFGPTGTIVFMFFHLFENIYRGIVSATSGIFHYDFRYYSLILFGLVLGSAGCFFLRSCIHKCLNREKSNKQIFISIALVALITAPLIPIIILSFLPLIFCVISLVALPFACKNQQKEILTINHGTIKAAI